MTQQAFRFDPVELPPAAKALRREVRAFLDDEPRLARQSSRLRPGVQPQDGRARLDRHDLAEAVWRPRAHRVRTLRDDRGNAGRRRAASASTGPPIGRAARTSCATAPRSRRTTSCRASSRGELSFCIGMSEPNSGSDLAGTRTRAVKVDGGFRINGSKLWTSNAHRADYMILFCKMAERRPGGGRSPRRRDTVPGGPEELARHRDPAGDQPAGRASLQPDLPHRPVRPRQPAVRRDRQRLAPGLQRTRVRTQRARPLPGAVQAADRNGARRRPEPRSRHRRGARASWCRSSPHCGACRCRSPACCRKACNR